jgi:hypothetical protein
MCVLVLMKCGKSNVLTNKICVVARHQLIKQQHVKTTTTTINYIYGTVCLCINSSPQKQLQNNNDETRETPFLIILSIHHHSNNNKRITKHD